jgi:peptide/nickel transport system ATP-binding protein
LSDPVLRVENLKKYYPVRGGVLFREVALNHAVDDVSFEVYESETLGLVGESGCGKSTVAKALLRLHEPTAGKVLFRGANILELEGKALRNLRKEIQIVFQDPVESLNSRHTVGAILEEPFVIHNIGTVEERRRWVDELLGKVGLQPDAADRYPHEFSGGQRQRIGIARAIALKPKLLICDEPVSALDVSIQSQILNLLLELQREMQLTMIFIAHNLSVVKHISDRIAVMYLGKIVELGPSEALYRNPVHPYTQALIQSIPRPDPANRTEFQPLAGEVPSPIDPPPGCHFHPRCPYAEEKCRTEKPVLRSVVTDKNKTRRVSCHFAENFTNSPENP